MRDVARIGPLIQEFGKIWADHPDMRFGQLYMNLTRGHWEYSGGDVWEIEDDRLDAGITYYKRHGTFPTLGAKSNG